MQASDGNVSDYSESLRVRLHRCAEGPTFFAELLDQCVAMAESVCHDRRCACGPGCPFCCALNVAVLLPEAGCIAAWVRRNSAATERRLLVSRLRRHRDWGRWMDDEERIMRQERCPFLDESGCCSIHAVRPLACRGVTSLDRERCAEAFAPGCAERDPCVPADLVRRTVYDRTFVLLADELGRRGYDDRSIELGSGVLALLEHPAYARMLSRGARLPRNLWG